MNRILVYGGAFDPVHKGHLALLAAAQAQIRPAKTLIVPSPDCGVQKDKTLFPASIRLTMLRAATENLTPSQILTYEMRRRQPTYTWQTLNFIKNRWPGSIIYFLLGSDNFPYLLSWRKARSVINDPRIFFAIGRRAGFSRNLKSNALDPKFLILKGAFPAVSSSALRSALLNPRGRRSTVLKLIDPAAALHLKKHDALIALARAYIKTYLPAARERHSVAVARLAVGLARIHGVDVKRAELAALLHDASRFKEKFKNTKEAILHGSLSAKIARETFGVTGQDILEAIRHHTVGRPSMKKLARLIYVADLASYDRTFPEAKMVRRLAQKNLHLALREAVAVKIRYLKSQNQYIHPRTIKFLKSLDRAGKQNVLD
ncbi:MAG: bis(5'-nucleosyl)-tetraphosphatase (symmetrical) YqeK [Elusimicrobia bacterium]|nr:bis(5'-nucleosyl)-tetraphosphatase (symmetrical) YqeK [Elusimicrobiota bacterium]